MIGRRKSVLLLFVIPLLTFPTAAGVDAEHAQSTVCYNPTYAAGDEAVFLASVECLNYLAAGSTPEKGEYAEAIRKGLDFVLQGVASPDYTKSGRSGFIAPFALLFLSEMLYDREKVKDEGKRKIILDRIQRCVDLIEAGQKENIGQSDGTDGAGAWGYGIGEAKTVGRRKAQSAVCCIIALIAARDAGAKVSAKCVEMGVDYLMRSVARSGEVGYQGPATDGHYAGYGRTAGALYIMMRMGKENTPEYKRAVKWLDAQKVDKDYEAHAGAFQAWGFVWGGLFQTVRGDGQLKTYSEYANSFFKDILKPDGTWNGKEWVLKQTTFQRHLTQLSIFGTLIPKGNIKVLMKK